MFCRVGKLITNSININSSRFLRIHNYKMQKKVTVLGASGGIGQPLSMLLKLSERIGQLTLYDIANVTGVAADLSHINTSAVVRHFEKNEDLAEALKDSDVVVMPAGIPRKPGMSRDDLFKTNANIVYGLSTAVAKYSPKAIFCIISNPVNSMVPIACEVFKQHNVYDARRIMGVTYLDVVRAHRFLADAKQMKVTELNCPVVGGHSGNTIIPLISQSIPTLKFPRNEQIRLTERIQNAGTEIVEAKKGAGSATLSMAYAAWRFLDSVISALCGEKGIVECAYVPSNVTELSYFSSPLVLGENGVEQNLGLGNMNDYEVDLFNKCIPELKKQIQKGIDFANEKKN
ncbi:hypothetical protein A3Q56_02081 [Intoshia linei]|uniref:Malate dehydrogenase, mitochondrial n=1 Tax=Intoshia linei TaxID=1819745 RepID=A0A177B7G8_9BILA|nr:hypothetical protein A3Q56_02081 [Intoshia linei]